MSHIVVGPSGGSYEKRIERTEFKGNEYINIRQFWEKNPGEYIPTKKGITFSVDQLGELIAALQSLRGDKSEEE